MVHDVEVGDLCCLRSAETETCRHCSRGFDAGCVGQSVSADPQIRIRPLLTFVYAMTSMSWGATPDSLMAASTMSRTWFCGGTGGVKKTD